MFQSKTLSEENSPEKFITLVKMSHSRHGAKKTPASRCVQPKKWMECFQTLHGAISVKTIRFIFVIIIRA